MFCYQKQLFGFSKTKRSVIKVLLYLDQPRLVHFATLFALCKINESNVHQITRHTFHNFALPVSAS